MATYKTGTRMQYNAEIRDRLSLPVPNTVRAGDPVKVGRFVGVAETDGVNPGAKSGINHNHATGNANVALAGVFVLKTTVHTGGATTGAGVFILPNGSLTTNAAATDAALFGLVHGPDQTAGADKQVPVFLVGISDK